MCNALNKIFFLSLQNTTNFDIFIKVVIFHQLMLPFRFDKVGFSQDSKLNYHIKTIQK